MSQWAQKLIQIHRANSIVTPVYIEMIAGTANPEDLEVHKAYLGAFDVVDGGIIPKQDWDLALQLAQRVRQNTKKRQLGDCLIRAMARRLNCEVITFDDHFPP